jgi:hypothetical protein
MQHIMYFLKINNIKNNIDSEKSAHVESSFHHQSTNCHEIWLQCFATAYPNIIFLNFFTISNSMADTQSSKGNHYRNNYIPLIMLTTWACSTQCHSPCNCMILLPYMNHTFTYRNPLAKKMGRKGGITFLVGMTAYNLTENFMPGLYIQPHSPHKWEKFYHIIQPLGFRLQNCRSM